MLKTYGVFSKFVLSIFLVLSLVFIYSCTKKTDIRFNVTPPGVSYGENISDNEENYDEDGNVVSSDAMEVALNAVYNISPLSIICQTDVTGSVANIDLVDNIIPSGIAITPAIPGTWRWDGEQTLVFQPTNNWTAGTDYSVTMSPEIFGKHLPQIKRSIKFSTQPFSASVRSSTLSREPGEERTPRFIAVIDFTHPVDKASFEKALKLTLDGVPVNVSITYDEAMRKAFIRSDAVEITDDPRKFVMTAKNVLSVSSKKTAPDELRASETVPGSGSLFYIADISASIVRDKTNTPDQTVFLEFSDSASRDIIADNLEIYLLPKDKKDPKNTDKYRNYDWDEDSEGAFKAINEAEKLPIVKAAATGLAETIHPFKIDIIDESRRFLLINFKKKIRSTNGFILKDTFYEVVEVPRYTKELSLIQDGALLSLSGEKILTFATRGLDEVKVSIGKLVDINQLQNVIVATSSGGLKYHDFTGDFDETNFAVFDEITIPLANKSPKDINYAAINLDQYSDARVGLYFIKAHGYDVSDVSRIILVTDTGIIRKVNEDGSGSVFAMSLKYQKPLASAKVDILGKNGVPIFSGFTDIGGRLDYPNLSGLHGAEKTPVAIVVKKNNDVSFLPMNVSDRMVNYSRFDIGGEETVSDNDGLRGFLFSDRGIYRPGEEVKIGGIVKQSDWGSVAGVTVEATIEDPADKNVLTKHFSLPADGIFDFSFKTETVSPTGTYMINLYLIRDTENTHLGSLSVDVQEFEADTMRVKTSIAGKSFSGWQKPNKVSGYIKVDNMFGNPASDRRIKWSVEVSPTTYAADKDGYIFTDPSVNKIGAIRKVFTLDIPDGKTNSLGEAKANFNFDSIGTGSYLLVLKGESFEPGSGDSVFSMDKAFISSLDYLVGYKTLGNLSFVRRDSVQPVDFIVVNNEMKKITLDNLKYRLVNISYVMSLVKGSDGAYRYQSVAKRDIVQAGDFKIPESGTTYTLPTSEAGRFLFEIYSPDNNVAIGRVPFFVTGATNLQSGVEKNAELVLQLNKSEYAPGETIEVNVISPYTGAGLITIERDKVYAYEWFQSSTTSSVQRITLPAGIEGNAYINVSFVRDPSSKEVFINPHSYGVVPFSINKEKRNIRIKLSAPDITVPGEEMVIKYSANKNAKLILYGADEGILQVADYRLPDPLSYFLQKRAFGVRTFQTVDLILPDYSIIREAFATGGGEAAIAKGLNPFARKTFKPSVFWSRIVDVEAGKDYEYKYTVPEYFNGTMKIMAVAATSAAVGSASTSALARSPIVMVANAPYAATEGDSFQMSVGVTNNIEGAVGSSDIKVTISPSEHLTVTGDKTKTVSVPVGGERILTFDIKTTRTIGAAAISIIAENDSLKKPVKTTATMSVRPASIYQTKVSLGKFKSAGVDIKDVFRNMHEAYGTRKIGVSSNPLAALVGVSGYLAEYPHGCSEQIVSQIFPLIYLNSIENNDDKNVRAVFEVTLDKLRSRQNGSSGFSLWSNYEVFNDFVNAYIMHFLIDSSEKGYSVPDDMMEDGIKFLNNISSNEPKNLDDARTKAYATYVLARSGVVVSRQISNLEEYLNSQYKDAWKKDLTAAYIGASYILMKEEDRGETLMKGVKPELDRYAAYSDYDTTSVRNSVYLYLTSRHFNENLPNLSAVAENILDNLLNGYLNTITSSYAIIALGSYASGQNNEIPKITAFAGKKSTEVDLKGNNKSMFSWGTFDNTTDKLSIKYDDNLRAGRFYYVLQSGYDKKTPAQTANGIEVTKEYIDSTGNKITELKQGDEATVRIRVRITDENINYINNVAVTDLLAGGIEVMRKDGLNLGNNYDIREDRVLIYTPLDKSAMQEFSFKIKALSSGTFNIPPVFAEDMYKSSVNASSGTAVLKIKGAE